MDTGRNFAEIAGMVRAWLSIFVLLPGLLAAQREGEPLRAVTDRLTTLYNGGKYDSLFVLFAPGMQAALPQEKAAAFFSGLQAQAGKILSREPIEVGETHALYKTVFDRLVLALRISIDDKGRISGLYVRRYTDSRLPELARNKTPMRLPFDGKWFVVWGGDDRERNRHADFPPQRYAFDFVVVGEDGKSYRNDGRSNADYAAYGRPVLAPCDGIVVQAVDGVRDNIPGETNPAYAPGNSVLLKTDSSEYLLLAHLQPRSLRVAEGDRVRRGDVLGLCGNSGNSTEPHIHFHIQNGENLQVSQGAKCYFGHIVVNGVTRSDYSSVKGEQVEP